MNWCPMCVWYWIVNSPDSPIKKSNFWKSEGKTSLILQMRGGIKLELVQGPTSWIELIVQFDFNYNYLWLSCKQQPKHIRDIGL